MEEQLFSVQINMAGVWTEVSDWLDRADKPPTITRYMDRLASVCDLYIMRPIGEVPSYSNLREFEEVRIENRTNPLAPYHRLFNGYIKKIAARTVGNSELHWDILCHDVNVLLDEIQITGTGYTIEPGTNDDTAIIALFAAYAPSIDTSNVLRVIGPLERIELVDVSLREALIEIQKQATTNTFLDIQRSTAYAVGDLRDLSSPNGFFYRCHQAGTTAASAPSFASPFIGQLITDGTVVWMCYGTTQQRPVGYVTWQPDNLLHTAPWTRLFYWFDESYINPLTVGGQNVVYTDATAANGVNELHFGDLTRNRDAFSAYTRQPVRGSNGAYDIAIDSAKELYTGRVIYAPTVIDESLTTNAQCLELGQTLLANRWVQETLDLPTYDTPSLSASTQILTVPYKLMVTSSAHALSQTPYAVPAVTWTLDNGVEHVTYEMGAGWRELGDGDIPTFLGGITFAGDIVAPAPPTWLDSPINAWIIENVRTENPEWANVTVRIRTNQEADLHRAWFQYRINNGGWQTPGPVDLIGAQLEADFRTQVPTDSVIDFKAKLQDTSGNMSAFSSPPRSLYSAVGIYPWLVNYSFEQGDATAAWGWTRILDPTAGAGRQSGFVFHGQWAAYLYSPSPSEVAMMYSLPVGVVGGRWMQVHMAVACNGVNLALLDSWVEWLDFNLAQISLSNLFVDETVTYTWTSKWGWALAPANAVAARIYIRCGQASGTYKTLYVDQVWPQQFGSGAERTARRGVSDV